MIPILNEFIQKYYLPPIGIQPENRVFSTPHLIISSILFILVFCIFYSVLKKKSQNYSKKVLLISAVLMLALEIFRISWNIYFHGFSITCFRFDFCNQICMVLPFIVLSQDTRLYPYIELLAIIGGFIVLVYPLWVFYDYAGFHLMALQSLTSHALMLLTGLVMPYASGYIPGVGEGTRDTTIGFTIILLIAFVASHVTGENYLLMKGANGVPLLQDIPFPYYWIVFIIIAISFFFILSTLYHDLVCYSAHISLNTNFLYTSKHLSNNEHKQQHDFLLFKFLRPVKYNKLVRSGKFY